MKYNTCGEILLTPSINSKHQYILKCSECDAIYSLLDAFLSHCVGHEENPTVCESNQIDLNESQAITVPRSKRIRCDESTGDEEEGLLNVVKDEYISENEDEYISENMEESLTAEIDADKGSKSTEHIDSHDEMNFRSLHKDMPVNEGASTNDLCGIKEYINESKNSILEEIYKHNEEQNSILQDIRHRNETNQKMLKQVLEEMRISTTNKKPAIKNKILPKTPFKTFAEFQNFEKNIEASEDKFAELVEDLMSETYSNSIAFIKSSWRKICLDEAAQHLSWQGTSSKLSVRTLSTTLAIKKVYFAKFAIGNDEEFQKVSISFFQHANNRLKKKESYNLSKK